jgi:uncharacterized protein
VGERVEGTVLGAEIRLRVPGARSLKEKRAALRPLVERLRARLPVSVAETGEQDRWQVAVLTVAVAASSVGRAESVMDEVERVAWSQGELEVTEVRRAWLEMD